jgi:glycosyltransferase involved in cell wall biosynthesis
MLGPRPYDTLPAYLRCFDVGLIPYQRNRYTAECSPLKLHEYLAAGLPVAAAGLPALRPFKEIIAYSEDGSDYVRQVGRALAEGRTRVAERQAVALRYTWDAKVDEAERLIREAWERR